MTPSLTAIATSEASAAIWLSALIDGEGCVWLGRLKNGSHAGEMRRLVSIAMTDEEVIDMAQACFDTLGVAYSRQLRPGQREGYRPVHILSVTGGAGINRLAEVLTLSHNGKRQRLIEAAASFKPLACSGCGKPLDQRTRGCAPCLSRMKYRRKHGLPNTPGKTGRPARPSLL